MHNHFTASIEAVSSKANIKTEIYQTQEDHVIFYSEERQTFTDIGSGRSSMYKVDFLVNHCQYLNLSLKDNNELAILLVQSSSIKESTSLLHTSDIFFTYSTIRKTQFSSEI
jgi:hypothetical protein